MRAEIGLALVSALWYGARVGWQEAGLQDRERAMTSTELAGIVELSDGTIATITGLRTFAEQDDLFRRLFAIDADGKFFGERAEFGANTLFALKNAHALVSN